MMLAPVPRDIDASRDPDAIILFDVIKKALQRAESARSSEQAAMHANGEHLGCIAALFVEDIERIAQVREERVRRFETLWRGEAHVVGIERVRNDQLRRRAAARHVNVHPEW